MLAVPDDDMMRRAARASGYAAVYVMGGPNASPVTIGVSVNARDLYRQGQRWREDDLMVYGLFWTPGQPVAQRLHDLIAEVARPHARPGRNQWYDVSAAWMCELIERAAHEAELPIFDDYERRQRLEIAIERALEQIDPTRRRSVQLPKKDNVVSLHQRLKAPAREG